MTTPQPPTPDLALPPATPPGSNDHQKPTRREQMLYAAAYAAQVLEDAAQHVPEPAEAHAAAEALRVAAVRLMDPKPRRQPSRLPRPGDATRAAADVSLNELAQTAALAAALARTGHDIS